MDSDSLGFGTCIRCNLRDDLVLVCGQRGCGISVHENCMGCEPKFEAFSGKFLCPFCEQKLAQARVKETRMKVMEAKRALSRFIDGDVAVGGGGEEKKNRDLDRVVENEGIEGVVKKRVCRDSEKKNENDDVSNKEDTAKRSDRFERNDGKKEEDLRSPMAEKKSPVSRQKAAAKRNVSISPARSTRSNSQAANTISMTDSPQEQRKRVFWSEEEEEMLRKGVQECSEGKGNMRWRRVLEYGGSVFHGSRTAEDLRSKWKSMSFKDGVRTRRSIVNFPREKRKRLNWTEEEDEMLRKGVSKCSNGKGNCPRAKILDYGRSVFHENRSPRDLKYKWRAIMAKDRNRLRR